MEFHVPEKFNTDTWQEYCQKQAFYDALVEEAQSSDNPGRYEGELIRRHQELIALSRRWALEVLRTEGEIH